MIMAVISTVFRVDSPRMAIRVQDADTFFCMLTVPISKKESSQM